jgi:hypothetical protein
MASRSLVDCDPILAEKFLLLQETYSHRFFPWFLQITCTYRTPAEQQALYAQGREGLDAVNAKRAAVGLPPISPEQNEKVTWTLRSRHTRFPSQAIDVVPAIDPDGPEGPLKVIVDYNDIGRFRPLVSLAEKVGLVSGGGWGKPDWPHIELPTTPAGEAV